MTTEEPFDFDKWEVTGDDSDPGDEMPNIPNVTARWKDSPDIEAIHMTGKQGEIPEEAYEKVSLEAQRTIEDAGTEHGFVVLTVKLMEEEGDIDTSFSASGGTSGVDWWTMRASLITWIAEMDLRMATEGLLDDE